jgi:hypothetical protein
MKRALLFLNERRQPGGVMTIEMHTAMDILIEPGCARGQCTACHLYWQNEPTANGKTPGSYIPRGFLECAESQNRTGDTRFFRPVLYRLSYLGKDNPYRFWASSRFPSGFRERDVWPKSLSMEFGLGSQRVSFTSRSPRPSQLLHA